MNFRGIFPKNTQIPNFVKIRSVTAEAFDADRRTDVTKLTVAFRNFASAPKNKARDRNCLTYEGIRYTAIFRMRTKAIARKEHQKNIHPSSVQYWPQAASFNIRN
jgi:hypothetical protein